MSKKVFIVLLVIFTLPMMALSVLAQPPIPLPEPAGSVATHIIVFKDSNVSAKDLPAVASEKARAYGLTITDEYRYALRGVAAIVPGPQLAALAADPDVAYIEANELKWFKQAQEIPTGIDRIFATGNANIDIDGSDDWRVDVDVAVVDTGVDVSHPDLYVVSHVDCAGGGPFGGSCSVGGNDQDGHGTHVAGTIGALDNGIGVVGVAPGARIHGVKVLGPRGGYTSWIVAGIEWVVAQGNIEVINMSLGGSGISTAYLDAIDTAVDNGVVVVVAAGNSAADANNYSPAYVPSAITVSALSDGDGAPGGLGTISCRADEDDTFANFSNYGSAVDIIAPGVCILSSVPGGGYAVYSGTSMASPHVAGAAALLASADNPSNANDVQNIRDTLVNRGNLNWDDSDDPDGIQERLLDLSNTTAFAPVLVAGNGGGGTDPTPTPEPTPDPGGDPTSISVSDLDGVANSNGGSWSATVVITVRDNTGAAVSGATVSGSFDVGGNTGCTTGASGACSVTSNELRKKDASTITFTVSGVSGSLPYNSGGNSDPDGDSNGTTIVVTR